MGICNPASKMNRSVSAFCFQDDALVPISANIFKGIFIGSRLSGLMDEGIEDKSSLYLKSNGFDRLVYGFGIRIDKFTNTIVYHGRNANKVYNSIEDIINCELTVSYESQRYQNKSNKEKWIKQLKEFEENKE